MVQNIKDSINGLILLGGKHFLILNLPDLSRTPYSHETHAPKNLSTMGMAHNEKLATAIQQLKADNADVNIHLFEYSCCF